MFQNGYFLKSYYSCHIEHYGFSNLLISEWSITSYYCLRHSSYIKPSLMTWNLLCCIVFTGRIFQENNASIHTYTYHMSGLISQIIKNISKRGKGDAEVVMHNSEYLIKHDLSCLQWRKKEVKCRWMKTGFITETV